MERAISGQRSTSIFAGGNISPPEPQVYDPRRQCMRLQGYFQAGRNSSGGISDIQALIRRWDAVGVMYVIHLDVVWLCSGAKVLVTRHLSKSINKWACSGERQTVDGCAEGNGGRDGSARAFKCGGLPWRHPVPLFQGHPTVIIVSRDQRDVIGRHCILALGNSPVST